MNTNKNIFIIIFVLSLLSPSYALAIPAFPGAEGMGAASVGGRGGTVYKVTNLNDSGSGSFRAACEASGARYVVFTVSGVIDLLTPVIIDDPYITIAGQTSPGGICISGSQTNINTHDVIVTYMRFRLGQTHVTAQNAEQIGDAVEIGAYTTIITNPTQYNIIFDHCSFSWGIDETVSAVCATSDVTFSWCIFGGGLYNSVHPESPHSAGFMAWAKYSQNMRISIHHSFFCFNMFRNPENNYQSFIDSTNNVNYYFQTTYSHEVGNQSGYKSTANIIGNYQKTTGSVSTRYTRSAYILDYALNPEPRIYMTGCLDGTRDSQADPQWSAQEYWHDALLSTNWRRDTPWPTVGFTGNGIPVSATAMDATYASYVVANAGATAPFRDSVDTAAITHYENNTGSFINGTDVDTLSEIKALVNLTSPAPPSDTDNDGMADSWETTNGLNTASNDSSLDKDGDGYTNIEEYFQYLSGKNNTSSSRPSAPILRIIE
jgi:pectate lyase